MSAGKSGAGDCCWRDALAMASFRSARRASPDSVTTIVAIVSKIPGSPLTRRSGMTPCVEFAALPMTVTVSRRECARAIEVETLKRRGRRECRVKASPMARLQQEKQAAVTTGSAEHPAFPARQFDGLYVLSPGTGLSCPRRDDAPRRIAQASASGCQDHTISPCASKPFVGTIEDHAAARRAHRIPPRVS